MDADDGDGELRTDRVEEAAARAVLLRRRAGLSAHGRHRALNDVAALPDDPSTVWSMEQGAGLFRSDEIARVDRGGGVYSLPMVTAEVGSQNLLTGITVFPPGGGIGLHFHSTEESVVVLEGEALCEVEGEFHRLSPYDAVYVPAGLRHRFSNPSSSVLRILWIYGAVDMVRTYVDDG